MSTTYGSVGGGTARVPHVEVAANMIAPIDRVRWGPIIAGLFSALTAMAILSVLGLAIGLSTLDRGDSASAFGWGAGIWGAISALLSFFFGGWVSARCAAVRGGANGAFQGAMVWMVGVPVIAYFLVGGVGSMIGTAGRVAGTAATTASNVAGQVDIDARDVRNATGAVNTDAASAALGTTQPVATEAREAVESVRASVANTDLDDVADAGARGAWGTLISMLIGLGGAALGGFIGVRDDASRVDPGTVR